MSHNIYKDPNRFYVYAYLREDGSPYYIGKGTKKRAWDNRCRSTPRPLDDSRISILKENLTEQEAFDHEKELIKFYGRKDNGTGILRNLTDGGEGGSGRIMSEESKKILSKARSGINHWNYGRKFSDETKIKLSLAKCGKKLSDETKKKLSECKLGEKHPRFGKKFPHSEETKRKIREVRKRNKEAKLLLEEEKNKKVLDQDFSQTSTFYYYQPTKEILVI